MFTDLHIVQFFLARTALRVEVLQNGLRANAVEIVKASAVGEFDRALLLTGRYEETLKSERENAEEALRIAGEILSGAAPEDGGTMMTRKEAAACLQVTADTLRNWELNGLLTVKRRQNGYRVYSAGDIRRLRIIRALRCANYSLAAILRMLSALTDVYKRQACCWRACWPAWWTGATRWREPLRWSWPSARPSA